MKYKYFKNQLLKNVTRVRKPRTTIELLRHVTVIYLILINLKKIYSTQKIQSSDKKNARHFDLIYLLPLTLPDT